MATLKTTVGLNMTWHGIDLVGDAGYFRIPDEMVPSFDREMGNGRIPGGFAWVSLQDHPNPPTPLALDLFDNRTVAAGGLGSASIVGGAYSLGGTFSWQSVSDGYGRHSPTANGTAGATLLGVSQRDVEVRSVVRVDQLPTAQKIYTMLTARAVDTSNYYRVVAAFATDATMDITAYFVSAGVSTAITLTPFSGSNSAIIQVPRETMVAETDYHFRAQFEGASPTTIRIKFWRVGTTEPVYWDATATDSQSNLQVAGGVGIRTFLVSGATNQPVMKYKQFVATVLPT